jgi:hypothetical protein
METVKIIFYTALLSAGLVASSFSGSSTSSSTNSVAGDCPPRLCDCVRDPDTGECRPPND